MARTAQDYDTKTKTARLRLAVRDKPYNRQAGARRLGYIRRAERNGAWLVIEAVPGTKRTRERVLGQADDLTRADGLDVLTYEQAMAKASAAGPLAQAGTSGGAHLTVAKAVDHYYALKKVSMKHPEETRARVQKHLSAELAATRVDRLTKTQLEKWLVGLVKGDEDAQRASKASANRVLNALRAPLNAAFQDEANGIANDAAWRRVKPFKGVAEARQHDLSPAEVRLLIERAASFNPALANLMEGTYLIGCRAPGELAGISVRDFDAANHRLFIPAGKTGSRPVTLTDEAVAFFKALARDKLPNAPLCPRRDGTPWPRRGHVRMVQRAVRAAKLPEGVSLYTLRHAHISRAIENGMPLSLIAENCGTSLLMIQNNYAKVLASTRRELVQKTAPRLRRIG